MTRTLRALVIALVTSAALVGCTNAVTGTGADDPATARIGLLLPDSVTARYDNADRPYFEERIAEQCPDCEVLYGNADGDAAKQQEQAESMLTRGVDVLVLDPYDGLSAAGIVSLASARGVPVIAYDRLIAHPDIAFYISFDNERVGRQQAESLLARLDELGVTPDDGGILMVNGSPTDNNASEFKRGAHEVLDASGFEILAEYDTPGWDPAKAQDWVTGQITQHRGRIVGVYAANDPTAGGAIASFKAAGVDEIPPVTGQDAELAGLQRILTGDQYMTVYKAIRPQAHGAADAALALVAGSDPDGDTTVEVDGTAVPAVLLDTAAVTAADIGPLVIADGFATVAQLCTADYAAACAEWGIT